jgi:hypothetical protein
MKHALAYATRAVITGLLVVIPIYLAVLLMLKGMKSIVGWSSLRDAAAGVVARRAAAVADPRARDLLLHRRRRARSRRRGDARAAGAGPAREDPGLLRDRSLTQQIAGESRGSTWKPALFQTDEGLLPAFIIEEHEDGRYTVFVPSIPTPFAGAVYVAEAHKVHPVDVPFPDALRTVSRWGSGAKDLVAAMERRQNAALAAPAPAARRRALPARVPRPPSRPKGRSRTASRRVVRTCTRDPAFAAP